MKLVSAASENHALSLHQFLRSVFRHIPNPLDTVLVYDLGLLPSSVASLQEEFPGLRIVIFPFALYPDYVQMEHEAGFYAWKPLLLSLVAQEFPLENLIWMDAGNIVKDDLQRLNQFITVNGVFTGVSIGGIDTWTHPTTLEKMKCPPEWYRLPNRNAACVGFCLTRPYAVKLLQNWSNAALRKEWIAPEGCSRLNHRHDQSLLTVLFYRCLHDHPFDTFPYLDGLGYTIHNDCDDVEN